MPDQAEIDPLAERLEGIRRALTAVANDRPTPEQIAEWNAADKAMAQRIRAALPGVPLHHVYAVLQALRVTERLDAAAAPVSSAVPAPATDQAEAIASCPGYETSPNLCRCPCYGCKHHCSAHNPECLTEAVPATDQAALDRAREIGRRLAAHAVGFQDVLDDTDRDPWAKTVRADIAALCTALDELTALALPASADRAAEAEPPLSPDYQHPDCGFNWHGKDGMDIPMRDGQPVCPRCELQRVEKLLAYSERKCEELRAESKRRGKVKLEYAEKNRLLERDVDRVREQLGAEILRSGQAEAELSRMADETQQPAAHARRGDAFEAWLKTQRSEFEQGDSVWPIIDYLLDNYRLHADTGTPLGEHVCEGRVAEDCECLEQPIADPQPVSDEFVQQPATVKVREDSETLRCVCGETAVRSGDDWVHEPGKGGTCMYRPKARPRCPDCQTPHDLTPGGMGVRACASILASLADRDAAVQQPKEDENLRTVCVCGHTRGEHLVVSGRLLCAECDPDSTSNLVCKEFEAL